jgi:hypothetical protein
MIRTLWNASRIALGLAVALPPYGQAPSSEKSAVATITDEDGALLLNEKDFVFVARSLPFNKNALVGKYCLQVSGDEQPLAKDRVTYASLSDSAVGRVNGMLGSIREVMLGTSGFPDLDRVADFKEAGFIITFDNPNVGLMDNLDEGIRRLAAIPAPDHIILKCYRDLNSPDKIRCQVG